MTPQIISYIREWAESGNERRKLPFDVVKELAQAVEPCAAPGLSPTFQLNDTGLTIAKQAAEIERLTSERDEEWNARIRDLVFERMDLRHELTAYRERNAENLDGVATDLNRSGRDRLFLYDPEGGDDMRACSQKQHKRAARLIRHWVGVLRRGT